MKLLAHLLVQERSQVADGRRMAVQMAKSIGFNESEASNLAIVVTEIGNNLVNHARGGELILSGERASGRRSIDLVAVDRGPGMDVDRALVDGYSTAGTSGTGLGAVRRLSDRFDCYSSSTGTVLFASLGNAVRDLGCVRVPKKGETACGDSWSVVDRNGARWILVSDGLGHGPFAAEASEQAIQIFENSRSDTVTDVMEEIHLGLRSTRGAAVAVAQIHSGQIHFCGLGNIGAVIQFGNSSIQMVSMSGTAGLQARKMTQFNYPIRQGSILILYSDGLQTQWGLERYSGILRRDPSVLAGVLYRDYNRGRDDVTVLVAKP